MKKIAILISVAFFGFSCAEQAPISSQLPQEATAKHRLLAALTDYQIFVTDVNAYLKSPSVTKEEAEQIDQALDKVDLIVSQLPENVENTDDVTTQLSIIAIETAIQQICAGRSEIASCAGRN